MYNFSNPNRDRCQLCSILYHKQSSFQLSSRAVDTPNHHPLPSLVRPNTAHSLLSPRIPTESLYTASSLPTHHHQNKSPVTQRNNSLLCLTPVPKHTRPCRCYIHHHQLHPKCLAPTNQAAQRPPTPTNSHCHASPASTPPNAKHRPPSTNIQQTPNNAPHTNPDTPAPPQAAHPAAPPTRAEPPTPPTPSAAALTPPRAEGPRVTTAATMSRASSTPASPTRSPSHVKPRTATHDTTKIHPITDRMRRIRTMVCKAVLYRHFLPLSWSTSRI